MPGFEYGNARLRAMCSYLLTHSALLEMAGAKDLPEYTRLLLKSPYQKSIEAALAQSGALDVILSGLRADFIATTVKVRGLFEKSEAALVDLVFLEYDVHNVKTILRGVARQVPRAEIENALLPVGRTSETLLAELLRGSSPREVVDILATIGHAFARPLLALRAGQPGAALAEMEKALARQRFEEIDRHARENPDGAGLLLQAARWEMDANNLLIVLRFAHAPGEKRYINGGQGHNGCEALFPALGTIGLERLGAMYAARNVKSALEALGDSGFGQALQDGLAAYERTGRLSAIEKALRLYLLRWRAMQIAKDPLGIGVLPGYMALKANELANLRRIALAIQFKVYPEASRAELEFAE